MNNASRKCRVIFREGSSFGVQYRTDVFHESRGNFAGRFARRKLFVWFVTGETSSARHRARWNAKRFRITTPGVEIHFFQSKSRTVSVRAARGGEGPGGEKRREEVREGERKGEPTYETVICTDSAIFLHLLAPSSSSCPLPPSLSLRPYPLIWNPQPNECTSAVRLTSTAQRRFPLHANILGYILDTVCHYYEFSHI